MIKPSIFFTFLLIVGLSAAIYGVENRVQTLHKELGHMQKSMINDREELHVLHAEWSYLTRPERVAKLAEEHLGFKAINANDILTIEQIGMDSSHDSPFNALEPYRLSQK